MIMVHAQYGANTLEVTAGLEKALAELKLAIAAQGLMLHDRIFRPANFIQASIRNINESLIFGAILVECAVCFFVQHSHCVHLAHGHSTFFAPGGGRFAVARHHAQHLNAGRSGDRDRRSRRRRHHRRREHCPPRKFG
jgi:AcrB/AcrD/AcrF family